VNDWQVKPVGSEGYHTAEVPWAASERDLAAMTMAASVCPASLFHRRSVDVTVARRPQFPVGLVERWAAGAAV
jgi:hypothetical protein